MYCVCVCVCTSVYYVFCTCADLSFLVVRVCVLQYHMCQAYMCVQMYVERVLAGKKGVKSCDFFY